MSLQDHYQALTSLSPRESVRRALQSIIDSEPFRHARRNGRQWLATFLPALPHLLPVATRQTLIQELLDDVSKCTANDTSGRLTRTDARLAFLALKTLGRVPAGSQVISHTDNLRALLKASQSLRGGEAEEGADEALRCVANALLLVEDSRTTWVEIGGADYCIEILQTTKSASHIFLASRILFLSTVSSSSPLLRALLDHPSSTTRNDIVETVSSRLDFLLASLLQGLPMSKEAMIDLLKFTFNLEVHWPKLVDRSCGAEGGADENEQALSAFGLVHCERVEGLLPPLLRIFLNLPPTSPSPLSAPMTHVVHALVGISVHRRLQSVWFPELPVPPSSAEDVPAASPSATAAPQASTSRSASPATESPKDNKDARGAFDRALAKLTPRLSLGSRPSSRSSSPSHRAPAPEPASQGQMPRVLARASDLLDAAMGYYLPGSIDPDSKSVRERCEAEDAKLDDVLSPLVTLMVRLCIASAECRRTLRERMVPANLDRTAPLEGRSDTLGRCIRLMACVYHPRLREVVGELLYAICESDAVTLSSQIGYGNAAGFLYNKKALMPPPTVGSSAAQGDPTIHPITGMKVKGAGEEEPAAATMTQEEKEREAEKLFVLFERLERAGGGVNPIKKALHEGALEKYQKPAKDDEDDD